MNDGSSQGGDVPDDSRVRWTRRYAGDVPEWMLVPHPVVIGELNELDPSAHPADAALDLGAGAGRHALWLAARGWRVTAVDFVVDALHVAERRARASGLRIRAVEADLARYRPQPASVGLALAAFVHPEPEARREMLTHAARALAPEGVLVLVGYHPDAVGRGYGGPNRRACAYDPEELRGELVGLRIDRCERVGHPATRSDGHPGSVGLTVVRAARD
ncbi:class I SAM-dependent methyltransferase [Streptomyces sp. NK08204]|uniref:class I SAM-dependent methyltransferase n=1 Tax=Streptomyces sp. NK08204 TaxID=2873260 RepID=UPI001CED6E0C|nr:class I SAM-dependent methyltransferase [Streptomyces sp. NK08204]